MTSFSFISISYRFLTPTAPCLLKVLFYYRVTCFGEAKIIEVQFQSKVVSDKKEVPDSEKQRWEIEVEAMKRELKCLEKEKAELVESRKLYVADQQILQSYTNSLLKV